jgi:hypothetical protein
MQRSLSVALTSIRGFSLVICVATLLVVGCGRSDSPPPVSEEEMEELELDFDMGMESMFDAPDSSDEANDDNDSLNEAP